MRTVSMLMVLGLVMAAPAMCLLLNSPTTDPNNPAVIQAAQFAVKELNSGFLVPSVLGGAVGQLSLVNVLSVVTRLLADVLALVGGLVGGVTYDLVLLLTDPTGAVYNVAVTVVGNNDATNPVFQLLSARVI